MSMGWSWTLIAALITMGGTVLQALSAFAEMREQDMEVLRTAVIVRDLRDEKGWWRPIASFRQRRLVRTLLASSPVEKTAYDRVNRMLTSWSLLATASFMATVGLLLDVWA
ncbi:hypothetical protein QUV83_05600 [Cellulomonas cellasea]|uniref:hypothetical protein n=1 Tax=Cellulomonas cellasea TaxID=43670 RepID=UPI0025A4165E|nr:hypothetical protein [Cellulomonas cellasea]MDM8084232.1 hypothetical protein [Cellulomonas cellasea]